MISKIPKYLKTQSPLIKDTSNGIYKSQILANKESEDDTSEFQRPNTPTNPFNLHTIEEERNVNGNSDTNGISGPSDQKSKKLSALMYMSLINSNKYKVTINSIVFFMETIAF